MKKFILFISLVTLSIKVFCQNEVDIRPSSYILGKKFYNDKDFLNAYKYLLAYKFAYYENAIKPENAKALASLNDAILYCEAQIKNGLSGSKSWEGRGWYKTEVETAKEKVKEKMPSLPDNSF
jgi:hypothetical protein